MKKCYIFGAAEGLPKDFKREEGDLIIAADAGFRHLEKMNIVPDIALGDFDSLGKPPKCSEVITHPAKKDDTDTMLGVKIGFERGYNCFVLYGCAGKRLDHTIANLQTLCYISKRGGLGFLCGDDFTATAVTNGKLEFLESSRGNVSIFSAVTKAQGVNLKGLLYELQNSEIDFDFPLGVSNEFIDKRAVITVKKGSLIVIWSGSVEDIVINGSGSKIN